MSLINDALKKAQRLRHEQQAAATAAEEALSGTPIKKRGKPMRAQSLILICAGAAVLVVASVLATFFLLTRDEPPPTPKPAIKPAPLTESATPSPVIVAPVIPHVQPTSATTPLAETPATTAPTPIVAATPTPPPTAVADTPIASSPVKTEPTPPAPTTAATLPAPAPPKAAADDAAKEKIAAFLDALRVTGVRSSGADSKVLMNDRVYRVNDLVDRSLGLKLIKVESDTLTFSDAAGATYTKDL